MNAMKMSTLVNIILGYAKAKATSRFLGVLAGISLIWFMGKYVGLVTQQQRLLVIVAILAIWAIYLGVSAVLLKRKGGQIANDVTDMAGQAEQAGIEVEELKNKMQSAIKSLKASHLGAGYSGGSALYALPWYMIIGPSAAGKSTLFANSGLHFPYTSDGEMHVQGYSGTRNCDWWFSDEAVLLDTAGRYTTQSQDRGEWLAFLKMLKKARGRLPINGVMVAISIADILTSDADGIERHVKIIRERTEELIQNLGVIFPVYLVFTKCDLIKGFDAFFGELSEQERKQTWGSYLLDSGELAENDPAGLFEEKMKGLYDQLCTIRLSKVSIERNLERKAEIFEFPNQFSAATEKLTEFVNLLFKPNPYQEAPWFAGVYFTSGTQEGTPIERLVGKIGQPFTQMEKPPERHGLTKSYFINEMFSEVIFKLQDLTKGNRKQRVVMRWLKCSVVSIGFAALVGLTLMLTASYTSNKILLKEGESNVAELMETLKQPGVSGQKRFEMLIALYAHYQELKQNEASMPWEYVLGVYAGDNQLPVIEEVLFESLEHQLKVPANKILEQKMVEYSLQWSRSDDDARGAMRENYYSILKSSLMLLNPKSNFDKSFVVEQLMDLWGETLGLEKVLIDERKVWPEVLTTLVDFYVSRFVLIKNDKTPFTQWAISEDQIKLAREQLYTPPKAQDLYAQIKNSAKANRKAINIRRLLSAKNRLYITGERKVRWLYTKDAWNSYVHDEIKNLVRTASRGDWVIGSEVVRQDSIDDSSNGESNKEEYNLVLAAELEHRIRALYFKDYTATWQEFLSHLHLRGFDTIESSAKSIEHLAAIDGPIAEIFQKVSLNINLADDPNGQASRVVNKAAELISGSALATARIRRSVTELDEQLRDLRRFTEASEKAPVSDLVNQYLRNIAGISAEIKAIASSIDASEKSQAYAEQILSGNAAESELYKSWVATKSILSGVEVSTHNAIAGFLNETIDKAWSAILLNARKNIELHWQNDVYPAYSKGLKGKFPFYSRGEDAALVDVADFLNKKSGVYWSFVEEKLSPFVKEKRGKWTERKWLERGLDFSPKFLKSLRIARLISNGMFIRDSEEPKFRFDVNPVPGNGLNEMSIVSSGQRYRYRNEPEEWHRFEWPGNSSNLGAKITGTKSGEKVELYKAGHWGLFHLLKNATVSPERGGVYLSSWNLKGKSGTPIRIRFRLRADRQNNLFRKGILTGFDVPESMFSETATAISN